MQKGEISCDPRGLIYEAYRIEGIDEPACRTVFLDWALGVAQSDDTVAHIQTMLAHYGPDWPDHPMTQILRAGVTQTTTAPKRRSRRRL